MQNEWQELGDDLVEVGREVETHATITTYHQIGDTNVGRCANPACQATGYVANFERDRGCYICGSPHVAPDTEKLRDLADRLQALGERMKARGVVIPND